MNADEDIFLSKLTQAWNHQLDLSELITSANNLHTQQLYVYEAILYKVWLSRYTTSVNHLVYFNYGTSLFSNGDMDGAKDAYLEALRLSSEFIQPHFNLGIIYEREGRFDLAFS